MILKEVSASYSQGSSGVCLAYARAADRDPLEPKITLPQPLLRRNLSLCHASIASRHLGYSADVAVLRRPL